VSIDAWIDDLLPTKWSRRIAVATIALSAGAFGAPSLLPTSWVPASPEHMFTVRLLLAAVVLLGGAIVVLALVVRSHQSQAKRIAELERELKERPAAKRASLQPINYDNRGIV
jgi:hypothetical protein